MQLSATWLFFFQFDYLVWNNGSDDCFADMILSMLLVLLLHKKYDANDDDVRIKSNVQNDYNYCNNFNIKIPWFRLTGEFTIRHIKRPVYYDHLNDVPNDPCSTLHSAPRWQRLTAQDTFHTHTNDTREKHMVIAGTAHHISHTWKFSIGHAQLKSNRKSSFSQSTWKIE